MQFEDIHLSDAQLYTLFRQYYKNGAYQEALNVLAQNPQLDLKAITADNLNELSERIYGMENVYYVEVEQYLANLLQSMQTDVNNLSNQNQYSATQQYYENNFVYYNDDVYFCIKEPPIGTDPTNTTYWLYLGLFGDKGNYGINNLTFVGPWNTNTFYTENQVVYIDKTFYWALQDNQGQDPSTQPNDYWGVLFVVKPQQILRSKEPTGLETNDFWFQSFGYIQSVSAGPSTSLTIDPVPNSNIKVTAYGYTNQEGEGDPSPDNVRPIKVGGVVLNKIVLNGSENKWKAYALPNGKGNRYELKIPEIKNAVDIYEVFTGYSSRYRSVSTANTYSAIEGVSVHNTTHSLEFYDLNYATLTLDDWKAHLAQNPLVVWIPYTDGTGDLYTPIITEGAEYHCECLPLNEPLCDGDYVTSDGVEYHSKIVITKKIADMDNQENYPGWRFPKELVNKIAPDGQIVVLYGSVCSFSSILRTNNATSSIGPIYVRPTDIGNLTQSQLIAQYPDVEVTMVIPLLQPETYTNPSTQFLANPNSSGTVTITGENTVSATYDQQRY